MIFLIVFISAFSNAVFAQSKTIATNKINHGFWLESMQDPNVNFYELQEAFNKYWEYRTDYKGNGYKIFRRWEYINETRVLPDGKLQPNGYVFNEFNRYMKEINGSKSAGGNWSIAAPLSYPVNNTSQPTGMGRINAIAFHPTDINTIYIGSPSGGLWKTSNHGTSWTNLCSNLPTLGVSSILVHPTDPNIIYIGTGDRDGDDAPGLGVYKTADGGTTWNNVSPFMGDVNVGAMIMHPSDPNTILAATYGGIYKTTDGGATWSQKISGDFRDIRFKPGNPSVIYTTKFITPSEFYRSSNTGDSWTQITSGIPASGIGSRMVIGVSAENSNIVYLVQINLSDETFAGILKSTDSGQSFITQSTTPNIFDYTCDGSGTSSQALYDLCITVDPNNANTLYVGSINNWKSIDGGVNWTIVSHWSNDCGIGISELHADQHCYEWSPLNGRLYVGHDGGISYTGNGGGLWTEITGPLPITQIYKIGQSYTQNDLLLYGQQDNGTAASVGSNLTTIRGGDGTECLVDYTNTNYCYDTYVMGDISRSTTGPTGYYYEVASTGTHGIGADESGSWVTPYFLHNTNPGVMFAGYENVFRCDNIKASPSSSVTWTAISTGETNTCRVLEQSPANPDIIYVTRPGSLKRTDNANDTPASVTWTACDLPGGSHPTDVKAHPSDANIVYAVTGSNVFKSSNKGASWTDISGNLPVLSINCLVIDKNTSEGIYIGNQTGVWYKDVSMTNWVLFSNGLPPVDIRELEIYYDAGTPSNNRIKAGTYGRGLWQSDLIQTNVVDPTNLTATAVSASQINLAWTKNPSDNDVLLAVSTTGTFGVPSDGTAYIAGNTLPSGGGTIIYNGGLTTYNNTSLSSGTTYYYKIWSVNGSNQYSAGLSPVSETTDCATISSLPYSEDFDNPTCWRRKDNTGEGNWQFGTTSTVNYTPALTTPYAYFKSEYGDAHNYIADLISPPFNLSGYPNISLQFNHLFDASSYYSSTGTVYYSIDNGSSWISLASYTSDSPNPQSVSLPVNGAAGQSQVKFKWTYTCSPTGAYMWCVDDIQISDNSNYWTGTASGDLTNWFNPLNWSTGVIPTALTSAVIPNVTNQPQINAAGAVCLNLTIQSDASLTMNGSTAYTLSVAGDWTNNGTFNRGIGTVDFNGTNSLQTIKGTSATAFYILQVTKGAQDRILEATALITLNAAANPLNITSGTFKLSSASTITPFTTAGGAELFSTDGIWNNGGTINYGNYTWYNAGLLKITNGTINSGTTTNNHIICWNSGKVEITGGFLNVAGCLRPNSGTSIGIYSQTGGVVTVNTMGSTATDRAPFEFNSGATFTMSNGTIIIQKASSNTTADYINLATTNTVTGGTLQIGNASTPASQTIRINSTSPIYNLVVNATNTPTAQLVTNGLTVMNDLTISGGTLNANNLNINVGGHWINNNTFSPGSGTVTFNGTSAQTLGGSASTLFYNLAIAGVEVVLGNTAESKLTTVNNALTINSGKKLTIPATYAMTVNGTITNNASTSDLVIKSDATGTGSLIFQSGNPEATVERYVPSANWLDWKDGWHFFSSPVAAQAISPAFTVTPADEYDIYSWYEPQNTWVNFKNTTEPPTWNEVNGGTSFNIGKGYMAAYKTLDTKGFTGQLNKNDVVVSGLTLSGGANKSWHLLGNPFSSALIWDATWTKSNIGGIINIWNEAGQSYTPLNADDSPVIPATNGFMVQVNSGTGSLTIPAAKRVHSAQTWYKNSEFPVLTLFANDLSNQSFQESQVRFNPASTSGFDLEFDGDFLPGYAPYFFSVWAGVNLMVNSLPAFSGETVIPFHFIKNEGTNFTITAFGLETLEPATTVYLKDNKLGLNHNLSENPVYAFTSSAGDNPARFELRFGIVGIDDPTEAHTISAWYTDGRMYVSTGEGTTLVDIFNVQGQNLQNLQLHGSGLQSVSINLQTGVYFVRLTNESRMQTVKMIVQ